MSILVISYEPKVKVKYEVLSLARFYGLNSHEALQNGTC